MRDYTPTTTEVDTGFTTFAWRLEKEEPGAYPDSGFENYSAVCRAFDRWLRQVKAEAWDEGFDTGYSDLDPENPYRKG